MFFFGGVDADGNYLNTTLRVIRPTSNQVQFGSFTVPGLLPRAGHSAVVAPQGSLGCTSTSGCVLVFGGRNADSYFNEMLRIDPGT